MTGSVLVDTDLVIDFLRGRGPGTALVADWLRGRRLRLSVVTLFELRSGRDWEKREPHIEALFLGGPLPVDRRAALRAGEIEASLRAQGLSVGLADTLQAGIAMASGLPLATRNQKHFARIDGLELVDLSSAS